MALLREIRRILKDDGIARIAVAGFAHSPAVARGEVVEDWPRAFVEPASQAVNYLFCEGQHKYADTAEIPDTFARGAGFSRVADDSAAHGVELRRQTNHQDGQTPPSCPK
jgi:hypothetical protein